MKPSLQLSSIELAMVNEVFQVLTKYRDKTRQFGLQLIHSHFPIAPDEILYETHDPKLRTLKIRPIKLRSFKSPPLATAWYKKDNGSITVGMFCCDAVVGGTEGSPTSEQK